MSEERFESWAIIELLGHRRVAGRVTEEERFGCKLGRVDIPGPDGSFSTMYFNGQSIYCLTPTTEEIARQAAQRSQHAPVHRWELPAPTTVPAAGDPDDEVDEDFDRNDYGERGP